MSFAQTAAEALRKEGVVGVLCVDSKGLCLHSEGKVPEGCHGVVAEMATSSLALVGDGAVVTAEGAAGKVLLSRCAGATLAIFMSK